MKINALEIFKNRDSEIAKEKYKAMNRGRRTVVDSYIWLDKSALVDALVIDNVWASDIKDVLEFLKELNIHSFVYADTSTECFKSIVILLENGCKLSHINYKKEMDVLFNSIEHLKAGILVEF